MSSLPPLQFRQCPYIPVAIKDLNCICFLMLTSNKKAFGLTQLRFEPQCSFLLTALELVLYELGEDNISV